MEFTKGIQYWAHLLATRVKKGHKFISYHIKSSLWCSIKNQYNTIEDNTKWIVGDGSRINFWLDLWLEEPLVLMVKIPKIFNKTLTVRIKDWLDDGSWDIPFNVQLAFPFLLSLVNRVQLLHNAIAD